MKRILLILSLALLCWTGICAQDVANVLLITKADESYVGYMLKENPSIVLSDETFDVVYYEVVDQYSYEEIASFSYISEEDLATMGISNVINDSATVKIDHDCITVTSQKSCSVMIFEISGKLLYDNIVKDNSTEIVDLHRFGTGIYILKVDSLTFKFSI